MEFKSQIGTTKEQSKRLVDMGINPDTADLSISSTGMLYVFPYKNTKYFAIKNKTTLKNNIYLDVTPSWSLHRLIEIAEKSGLDNVYIEDNWYDEIIAIIQSYIHLGYIKEEYLDMDIVNANEDKNMELLKNGGE